MCNFSKEGLDDEGRKENNRQKTWEPKEHKHCFVWDVLLPPDLEYSPRVFCLKEDNFFHHPSFQASQPDQTVKGGMLLQPCSCPWLAKCWKVAWTVRRSGLFPSWHLLFHLRPLSHSLQDIVELSTSSTSLSPTFKSSSLLLFTFMTWHFFVFSLSPTFADDPLVWLSESDSVCIYAFHHRHKDNPWVLPFPIQCPSVFGSYCLCNKVSFVHFPFPSDISRP